MAVKMNQYQVDAIGRMKNGSVLCGGVGSGKSITSLGYYIYKVCGGDFVQIDSDLNEVLPFYHEKFIKMKNPRDLYIITTAKKRDSLEWEKECANITMDFFGVKVTVDSWNNIKKYKDVYGAFFIFDEQRLVGSGVWVKAFYNIARKNKWVMLTATPGDVWIDYVPLFVANGFYRNKSEFIARHCLFNRYSKYPKIDRYLEEDHLENLRSKILVELKVDRHAIRHMELVSVSYDREKYRTVMKDRWNIYDNCPIENISQLMYLIRKVVNSDKSRLKALDEIIRDKKYVVLFYNFDYELEMIKTYLDSFGYNYKEWNGHKHEELPRSKKGWVYLVQYSAGCEGWNCITTDTIVFFSQNYSYRVFEQACGRIDRMNTPFQDLYYYQFRSNAPIDLAIYSKIKMKKNFNERSFMKDG